MKVLLIYPYFLDRRIHESEISVPPTGLYYVGAMLAHHGYPVEIFNWYDVDRRPDEIEAGLRNAAPDVVGFSILHANRWGGLDLAAAAKRLTRGFKRLAASARPFYGVICCAISPSSTTSCRAKASAPF